MHPLDNLLPDARRLQSQLDTQGYVVLPGFIDEAWLAELREATERQFELEGERAGWEFRPEPGSRRLANLVNKGEMFRRMVVEPRLLTLVGWVLGTSFKLSSLNARSANPRNGVAQPLHADMGALPDEQGYWVCNSVWTLDDFTLENGALRVIPGSHRWGELPQQALPDPLAPHPNQQTLTGAAGAVLVMNAHAWHGGLENRTDRPRTALHAFYVRRDKPQQQYQKQWLASDLQAGLAPQLRHILALDDPLNDHVSQHDPSRSGFLQSLREKR